MICCSSLLSLFYCAYVFFFKQKTAYEMRISDWSSDVCSSDLLIGGSSRGRRWKETAALRFAGRLWRCWRAPSGAGGGGRQHDSDFVQLPSGEGQLRTRPLPCEIVVLARMSLQQLHAPKVNRDLTSRAQSHDALFHCGFAEPGNAVQACWPWLLQFAQQLSDSAVLCCRFKNQILEILRYK